MGCDPYGPHHEECPHPPSLILCAGSGVGGMERVVLSLSRGLSRRGADVRVVLPDVPGAADTAAFFVSAGAPAPSVSQALAHAFGHRRLGGVPALAALVRDSGARVVNLHHGMNFPPLNDVLAVRLGGARCVASVHAGGGADPPARTSRALKNRLAASLCSAVVAVSAFQAERLVRDGVPASRVRVVPNGADAPPDPPPARRAARQRLGLPAEGSGAFLVATASRLTDRKGTDDLIAALGRCGGPDGAAPVFLAVAGSGPERERLEELAAALLPGRHRFLGRLGPGDMEDLYAAADLFALPSCEESFGLAFAEAALRGLPAVGARVGGVPETVCHGVTGLLVPPGDVAALARAVRVLRDDPAERGRLGRAARRFAASRFTADAMTDRYQDILGRATGYGAAAPTGSSGGRQRTPCPAARDGRPL